MSYPVKEQLRQSTTPEVIRGIKALADKIWTSGDADEPCLIEIEMFSDAVQKWGKETAGVASLQDVTKQNPTRR